MEKRQPIGIELVKKGVVKEADIEKALDYQKTHPNKKIGDILDILKLCDSDILINAMGEILDEKAIYLQEKDVRIDALEYISLDIMKQNKAIPFEIASGKIKVCFADTSNKRSIEVIRLLLLNKGLVMEKYITFETNIEKIIESLEGGVSDNINTNADIFEEHWDKPENEWEAANVADKSQTFYCTNLCSHRNICPELMRYKLSLDLKDTDNEDLF